MFLSLWGVLPWEIKNQVEEQNTCIWKTRQWRFIGSIFFVCWGHTVVSFMSVAHSQRPKAKTERQTSESYKSLFDSKPYLFQAVQC